jgi:hypothetical protein
VIAGLTAAGPAAGFDRSEQKGAWHERARHGRHVLGVGAALQASEDAVAPERERAAETAAAASGPTVERYEVVSSSS